LDRIINFFIVEINDDLATQALDKWSELKINTKQTIKEAMTKKNKILMNIKPRKIIVPINRYDLKNSKWLQLEIGEVFMENRIYEDIYSNRNNLIIKGLNFTFFDNVQILKINEKGFKIVSEVTLVIGFALLPDQYSNKKFPNIKLYVDIRGMHIQATEYVYTLLEYIIDIFR